MSEIKKKILGDGRYYCSLILFSLSLYVVILEVLLQGNILGHVEFD